jgi:hypothetical protein
MKCGIGCLRQQFWGVENNLESYQFLLHPLKLKYVTQHSAFKYPQSETPNLLSYKTTGKMTAVFFISMFLNRR